LSQVYWHRGLEALAEALLKAETMDGEAIEQVLGRC
jgi:hypothetical protein